MAKNRKPRAGRTGEDEVPSSSLQELGDTFLPDRGRQALAGGGAKRGEALQVTEEDDDFEDGRSSGGLSSRSQEDQWARGDVGSRAVEARAGVFSVEKGGRETARRAVPPRMSRGPEEGRGRPEHRPSRRRRAAPRARGGRRAASQRS